MESESEFVADYEEEEDERMTMVDKRARLACPAVNCQFVGDSERIKTPWRATHCKKIQFFLGPYRNCQYNNTVQSVLELHVSQGHGCTDLMWYRGLSLLCQVVGNRFSKDPGQVPAPVRMGPLPVRALPFWSKGIVTQLMDPAPSTQLVQATPVIPASQQLQPVQVIQTTQQLQPAQAIQTTHLVQTSLEEAPWRCPRGRGSLWWGIWIWGGGGGGGGGATTGCSAGGWGCAWAPAGGACLAPGCLHGGGRRPLGQVGDGLGQSGRGVEAGSSPAGPAHPNGE